MDLINEQYLDRLISDLHLAENNFFTNSNNDKSLPKVTKLKEKKAKLISQLKYNASNLKRVIEELDNEIKNPKVKPVGI